MTDKELEALDRYLSAQSMYSELKTKDLSDLEMELVVAAYKAGLARDRQNASMFVARDNLLDFDHFLGNDFKEACARFKGLNKTGTYRPYTLHAIGPAIEVEDD